MLKRAILLLAAFAALFICVRLTDVRALDAAPAVAQSIPDTLGLDTKAKAAVVLDAEMCIRDSQAAILQGSCQDKKAPMRRHRGPVG